MLNANVVDKLNVSGETLTEKPEKTVAEIVKIEVETPSSCIEEGEVRKQKMLNKPVFLVDTPALNKDSGFSDKRLCDGPTFSAGTACAYSCTYCYVCSMVLKQKVVGDILKDNKKKFADVVIRRKNALRTLVRDLTKKRTGKKSGGGAEELLSEEWIKEWDLVGEWSLADRDVKFIGEAFKGKVVFASPLVDVAATKELADETIELCSAILLLTDYDIRLLSKSPLLVPVAEELHKRFPDSERGAKARVIFGLSTGTLDDAVAKVIEKTVPPTSKRIEALHKLQDLTFRTYGMLCPILPMKDKDAYDAFAKLAMEKIRAEKCEEIWAEAVNFRTGGAAKDKNDQEEQDSFTRTKKALEDGKFQEQARLFAEVAANPETWEAYSRQLFESLAAAVAINHEFFAGMLGGDSRLGHKVIYFEPEMQFYFFDSQDKLFKATTDQKLQSLIRALLIRCAEEMPPTVHKLNLFLEFRSDKTVRTIISRAKSILAADHTFFSPDSNHARLNGPELYERLAKVFVEGWLERGEGETLPVSTAFLAFSQFLRVKGMNPLHRKHFKNILAPIIKERFDVGMRNDVLGENQKQGCGWKHLKTIDLNLTANGN